MKKIFSIILSVLLLCISVVALTACDNNETESHDHYDGSWIVTKQATCTEEGLKEKKCALCDEKLTEKIPALGHDFQGGQCTRCGLYNYDLVTLELSSDGNSYTLTAIKDKSSSIFVVPSTYNGKPVTVIGSKAFQGYTALTELTVPDSIKSIEADAFLNLKISKVHVSDMVEWSSITFGNSYSNPLYNGGVLAYNDITGSTLGKLDGATLISAYAFYGNENFSKVPLTEGIVTVGRYAFANTNVKELTIPLSCKTIEVGAFADCPSLTTINYKKGTKAQFKSINLDSGWINGATGDFNVMCSDGTLSKADLLK